MWDKKTDSSLNVEKNPASITAADIDGDNAPEIAFGLNSSINIIKGPGPDPLGAWSVKSASPASLTIADANKDDKPDIIFISPPTNSVALAAGKGDGTFDPPVAYDTGASPQSVALGDFDGDGNTDAVVAVKDANRIEIFYGIGTAGPTVADFTTGLSPVSVAVGDFNGDGRPDIVTANSGDNTISIFINGSGGFSGPDIPAGTQLSSVAVADLDGDGKADIAVAAGYASSDVTVFWGNGDGTFITANPVKIPVGLGPVFLLAVDIDGDGNKDFLTANSLGNSVTVALGMGDGSFHAPRNFNVGLGPVALAVADFDGDGVKDIVTADGGGATLTFLYGKISQYGLAYTTQLPTGSSTIYDFYDPNSSVSRTAPDQPGYVFTGWSGDSSGMDRTVSLTMDSDKHITANYALKNGPQLSFSQNGGSVTFTADYYEGGAEKAGYLLKIYAKTGTSTKWALKASGAAPLTKTITFKKGSYTLRSEYSPSAGVFQRSPELPVVIQPVTVAAQVKNAMTIDSTPILSWTAFSGATGYVIQTSTNGKFPAGYKEGDVSSTISVNGSIVSAALPAEMALTRGVRTFWRVIALLPNNGRSLPSAPRYLTYKEGTDVTIVDVGQNGMSVRPSANLAGAVTGPLSGKTLYFYYQKSGTSTWKLIGSAMTNSNGDAAVTTAKRLTATGSYTLKVLFKGDIQLNATYSTASFSL